MIGIVDYGMGNLASVANAFVHLGFEAEVLAGPAEIDGHERLVLPGVGSFAQARANLEMRGWVGPLVERVADGMPLLGICLGMQLLLSVGEEHGPSNGLGFLPGRVVPLAPGCGLRVPHVGWNALDHRRRHPLFDGVKAHVDFYFVHSFQCVPEREADIVADCVYGSPFAAVVGRGNVVGVQFHPEKSQDMGLKLLEKFALWDGEF